METGLLELLVPSKKTGMSRVCITCAGKKPWPDAHVDAEDLTGEALDTKFEEADTAAAADPVNGHLRMQAAFAYAVARDYKYGCASAPRFHFAHGAQSALRTRYAQAALTMEATVV
jgi:hypothetical protein